MKGANRIFKITFAQSSILNMLNNSNLQMSIKH